MVDSRYMRLKMMVRNNREKLLISVITLYQSTLKDYKMMKKSSPLHICDKL